jgi:hypothetical protein
LACPCREDGDVPELTAPWGESWLWLGGSLMLAVLYANLAWFFRQPRPGAIGKSITRLVAWRFSPWLLQFLRLLYYIGVPVAAVLWGHDAIVGRLLGLQPLNLPASGGDKVGTDITGNWLDWAYDVGWAAALGVGAWVLLTLGWWSYRRALHSAGIARGSENTATVEGRSRWALLREAAYHEVHWAFYRNAPILAVGMYWGLWLGLIVVALEAVLNPAWRKGLANPHTAPCQLARAALAIVSNTLFLLTQNLWLALTVHWGASWGLAAVARISPRTSAHTPDQLIP